MKASILSICLTALGILLSTTISRAQGVLQDVKVSSAVDIAAPISIDGARDNKLNVRSAELLLYGPIDHIFDGVFNIAGHNHEGKFEFELHEGFVSSSKLIPQSRFRIGKFYLSVGRLNGFHQHEWPFTTAPKVHREFLSPGAAPFEAEGASDTGVEYSWLLPTSRFVDITIGVTNGYCYGHCEDAGLRPPHPLVYIHPTTFFDLSTGRGLLLGGSYLRRHSAADQRTELFGIDLTYKAREGKLLRWLVQGEMYLQLQKPPGTEQSEKFGFYVYPQVGFSESWYFGCRLDGFSHLNLKFETGDKRKDFDYAVVPTLAYKPSEFSVVKLSYSHEIDTTQGSGDALDRQIQLQFTYFLGAHPAHDF